MKRLHWGVVLALTLAMGSVVVDTAAQETVKVSVGGEQLTVVRDGNAVRLGSGAAVTVSGDWRTREPRFDVNDSSILVGLGAVEEAGRMRLNLAGDVLFDFDSTAIRRDAASELSKVAYVIRSRSAGQVEVIGHTDSVGDDAYNQRLSEARALAVIRWLNAQEGIPSDVMVGRGMGESEPVAYNTMPNGADNPDGRAQNRRVEIRFATTEGGTRVQVGDTAVKVEGDTVTVGGTTVAVGDVLAQVGGVAGTTAQSSRSRMSGNETQYVCPAAQNCNHTCSDGDCSMTCSGAANCNFTCSGGGCNMVCASGANCTFSCSGGDCTFSCASGSQCSRTCSGGDCVCSGPGC
jgi:outer membrane protein OmpA-like peptidoglycan-associated protein